MSNRDSQWSKTHQQDDELIAVDKDVPDQIDTSNIKTNFDIAYGNHPLEKLDVYAPEETDRAPVIVMVHGGGWAIGDKANALVIKNKVSHWLPLGYVFISINYPMLPDARPDQQAEEVAKALAYIKENVATWGGDPSRMIVMGHSAGGHLVALVSAKQDSYGLLPWSGSIILDGAGYNIVNKMTIQPTDIYTNAFGDDPAYWAQVSPHHQFHTPNEPLLLVCSSKRRKETSCDPAYAYAEKVNSTGGNAQVIPFAFSHEDINRQLGLDLEYTTAVDAFIEDVLQ